MNQIKQFQLQDLIGEGGMGSVYRGVDTENDQIVAIKSLKPDVVAKSSALIERFRREGDILRRLDHPNIVKTMDAFEQDGVHYLVMEYVEGGSLKELLDQTPQLSISRALDVAAQVAEGLDIAHENGIIHRDIKPDNILLTTDGTPKLTDFGTAFVGDRTRITKSTALIGTDAYLSPEACYSLEPDERTDIWSLGVVIFEMLAGVRPFGGQQIGAIVTAILTRDTPNLLDFRPDVPPRLAKLIERMLEKERDFRIGTARDVISALQKIGDTTDSTSITIPHDFDEVRHNLPTFPTAFVGRNDDIQEISALLDNPECRLVTVVGVGGMGKTRLSIEIARQHLAAYKNGVWFVPLQAVNDVQHLESAITTHVNFNFYGDGTQREQLLNFFRAKHMLLILDNFEHLLDGADLVAEILAAAPNVKIIATSREVLNLSSEWTFALHGFEVPQRDTGIEDYSAVKLFVQRAQRAKRDFDLDNQRACVRRVVELVEGMPLGIELAAVWLKRLSCERIADEIAHNLDFLSTNLRDTQERHRSMRAVFDHSWALLTNDEQDALMKVSVFRGGFTEEAAQEVAGVTFWTLVSMVDKSLLRLDDTGRYDMHRLVQQYAEEQLQSDGSVYEIVMAQHSAFYLDTIAEMGFQIEDLYFEEVLAELQNIELAVVHGVSLQEWVRVEQCVTPLASVFFFVARIQDGLSMCETILGAEHLPNRLRGIAMVWRSRLASFLKGKTDAIQREAQEALSLLRQEEPSMGLVTALLNRGLTIADRNISAAEALFHEGLRLAFETESWYFAAQALNCLALNVYRGKEHLQQSERSLREALAIQERHQLFNQSAFNLLMLAELSHAQGNFDKAFVLIEESISRVPSKNTTIYANAVWRLAELVAIRGDEQLARLHFTESIQLAEDLGSIRQVALSYMAYGLALWRWGDNVEARRFLEQALGIRKNFDNDLLLANDLINLGHPTADLGETRDAWNYYVEAINIASRFDARIARNLFGEAVMGLANILGQRGESLRAVEYISIALGAVSGDTAINKAAEIFLSRLEAKLLPDEFAAAIEHGKTLELETVIEELLAMEPPA